MRYMLAAVLLSLLSTTAQAQHKPGPKAPHVAPIVVAPVRPVVVVPVGVPMVIVAPVPAVPVCPSCPNCSPCPCPVCPCPAATPMPGTSVKVVAPGVTVNIRAQALEKLEAQGLTPIKHPWMPWGWKIWPWNWFRPIAPRPSR